MCACITHAHTALVGGEPCLSAPQPSLRGSKGHKETTLHSNRVKRVRSRAADSLCGVHNQLYMGYRWNNLHPTTGTRYRNFFKHVELINRRMVPLDKPAVGHLIFQTPVSPLNMFQQTQAYYQVTDVLDCPKDPLCYGLLVVQTSGQLHGL